jgi:hypothetical protein
MSTQDKIIELYKSANLNKAEVIEDLTSLLGMALLAHHKDSVVYENDQFCAEVMVTKK